MPRPIKQQQKSRAVYGHEKCAGTHAGIFITILIWNMGIPTAVDWRVGLPFVSRRWSKQQQWMVVFHLCWHVQGATCKFDNQIALFTYGNISIHLTVFRLRSLNCFHRSDFRLVFGTRVYFFVICICHVDGKKSFPFRELRHFLMCFLKIPEYTSVDNHTGMLYYLLSILEKLI